MRVKRRQEGRTNIHGNHLAKRVEAGALIVTYQLCPVFLAQGMDLIMQVIIRRQIQDRQVLEVFDPDPIPAGQGMIT